jgi:tetratricopeptide (TPR) repeat protein
MLLWPLSKTALSVLALAAACAGQRPSMAPAPVTLRLFVTVDSDSQKAANVTVELMDAVGFSSAMSSKLTDTAGTVTFRTLSGGHRVRITGPDIEAYEGDLEIAPNEPVHMERIRVHRVRIARPAGESPPGNQVPAIRLHVPAAARKAFDQGTEAMRQQLWEKSRTLFETAIREYPQYDMAYNGLGAVQMQTNDVDAARQSFSKALELNPDFAGANRNLARLLLGERKNREALPLLLRSLTTEPDNVWALTNAANSEFLQQDFSNAVLYARKVHSLPHDGFASAHIVAARALEATQQPAEALAEYRLYLAEAPKGPDAERAQAAVARLGSPAPR